MNALKKRLSIICFVLSGCAAFGQIPNLANFDERKLRFGYILGYNQMLFDFTLVQEGTLRDTIINANSLYMPGFDVSIVADLRLNKFVNLRCTPGLSFVERRMLFYTRNPDYPLEGKQVTKSVESVYLNIPLLIKLRSLRWINFRPYVIFGPQYSFDLASFRKIKPGAKDDIFQINPHDFLITGGFGFDFYLRYIKLGIEFKLALGTQDLLDPEAEEYNIYVRSLSKMTSRIFNFTIIIQ